MGFVLEMSVELSSLCLSLYVTIGSDSCIRVDVLDLPLFCVRGATRVDYLLRRTALASDGGVLSSLLFV